MAVRLPAADLRGAGALPGENRLLPGLHGHGRWAAPPRAGRPFSPARGYVGRGSLPHTAVPLRCAFPALRSECSIHNLRHPASPPAASGCSSTRWGVGGLRWLCCVQTWIVRVQLGHTWLGTDEHRACQVLSLPLPVTAPCACKTTLFVVGATGTETLCILSGHPHLLSTAGRSSCWPLRAHCPESQGPLVSRGSVQAFGRSWVQVSHTLNFLSPLRPCRQPQPGIETSDCGALGSSHGDRPCGVYCGRLPQTRCSG